MTKTNNAVREIIASFLTTRAYIIYRLVYPICLYLPVSFFFCMVNLPSFKVHFGSHFTCVGGFFLWWFALFLDMATIGLATEPAIIVLGLKFTISILPPIIIVNMSVVSLLLELQPWIYRYGVAMPFYNCNRIIRTLPPLRSYLTPKNQIGQNMLGILLASLIVDFITISLGTWLFRRKRLISIKMKLVRTRWTAQVRLIPSVDWEFGLNRVVTTKA